MNDLVDVSKAGDVGDAVTLRGVSRAFAVSAGLLARKRRLVAVKDTSLSVARGTIQGIVGESGCGKSTLARMILGLDAPSQGELLLFGRPVAAIARRERARMVQPVFQDPYSSLNPSQTVGAIIAAPLAVHGIDSAAGRRGRVVKAMTQVGLASTLVHTYPAQLSGGQRQRVAIARALVLEPRLLVCDEPTSALDVSVQAQIINLLQDLHRALDLTIILISHNLGVVEHLAERVAVMYLGRIVEEGPSEAIFATPRHPYTAALLASSLKVGPGDRRAPAALKGDFPDPLAPPSGCEFHPRCVNAGPGCDRVAPETRREGGQTFACRYPCGEQNRTSHGTVTALA